MSYARLPIVREEFGKVLRDRRWTFALLLLKELRLSLFVKCFETLRDSRRVVALLLCLCFRIGDCRRVNALLSSMIFRNKHILISLEHIKKQRCVSLESRVLLGIHTSVVLDFRINGCA